MRSESYFEEALSNDLLRHTRHHKDHLDNACFLCVWGGDVGTTAPRQCVACPALRGAVTRSLGEIRLAMTSPRAGEVHLLQKTAT